MSRPIYTVAQIRAIEKRAFARAPSFAVMRRAADAVAAEAQKMRGDDGRPILILAGPGNNGGDALAAAALLRQGGAAVRLAFAGKRDNLPADAAQAHDAFAAAGGTTDSGFADGDFALIIDGLFGIGLAREIGGVFADWIVRANALDAPIVAIDAPSGVNADTGACGPTAIAAARTVTFFGLKPGLCTGAGLVAAGETIVADLGENDLPTADSIVADEAVGTEIAAMENPARLVRRRDSHKGDFGALALFGGADGMVGALALAARAAVALGAGKVFAVALADHPPTYDPLCPEAMWRKPPVWRKPPGFDCAAAGVGMGQAQNAKQTLRQIIQTETPLVLDADALNLIAADSGLQNEIIRRAHATVATPHPAEAARLLATTTAAIQADRLTAAKNIAQKYRAIVVLKGAGTIIAHPSESTAANADPANTNIGNTAAANTAAANATAANATAAQAAARWAINAGGNPGLAQGGAGDVLTGIIGALLAQSGDAAFAARNGVWLHTAAADALAAKAGEIGLPLTALAPTAAKIINRQIQTGE